MIYFLLGPAFTIHGTIMGRRKRVLFEETGGE